MRTTIDTEDQFLSSLIVPCIACDDVMCDGFCDKWYATATAFEKNWAYDFGLYSLDSCKGVVFDHCHSRI